MGKKRRILLAVLLLVVLGGLAWWLMRPREPYYEGKSLSVWLEDYAGGDAPATDDAVRHIGTNAIPTLLRMLRANDSPLKAKLIDRLDRQDLVNIKIKTASEKNAAAAAAFDALGPQGASALPQLIMIYGESSDNQWAAACCIASIGPQAKSAIPLLLTGLKSRDASVRGLTAFALGRIHGEPDLVVPQLTKILHDPYFNVRRLTVAALGEFGTNAGSAFPDMVVLRNDPRMGTRVSNVLKQIDPEAAARAGIK